MTGSADRTVKFWDLETFEIIGSAGPEVLEAFLFVAPFFFNINNLHSGLIPSESTLYPYSFCQAGGVHAMTFHPDGRTLFCGLDSTLKVCIDFILLCFFFLLILSG